MTFHLDPAFTHHPFSQELSHANNFAYGDGSNLIQSGWDLNANSFTSAVTPPFSAVTPPYTSTSMSAGHNSFHCSAPGSETDMNMEEMETLKDDYKESPAHSISRSSWSQQGYVSPVDPFTTNNTSAQGYVNGAAMQRTASTPQIGTTNDLHRPPIMLRTSSSTPKLLLASKPSASWTTGNLGKRSSSVGEASHPWGGLQESFQFPGQNVPTASTGIPPGTLNGFPSYANRPIQAAQPQIWPSHPFRFNPTGALMIQPQMGVMPQSYIAPNLIPAAGLHQTLFSQGRRDSQPRLTLNIPGSATAGSRSAGPGLNRSEPSQGNDGGGLGMGTMGVPVLQPHSAYTGLMSDGTNFHYVDPQQWVPSVSSVTSSTS
jgi:hypothetical protein